MNDPIFVIHFVRRRLCAADLEFSDRAGRRKKCSTTRNETQRLYARGTNRKDLSMVTLKRRDIEQKSDFVSSSNEN